MTKEIDGLISYFASTGVFGVVTGLNGPGHARTSYHYASGTPSSVVHPLDLCNGKRGQAVDFGLPVGHPDDPRCMDIFRPISVFSRSRGRFQVGAHDGDVVAGGAGASETQTAASYTATVEIIHRG